MFLVCLCFLSFLLLFIDASKIHYIRVLSLCLPQLCDRLAFRLSDFFFIKWVHTICFESRWKKASFFRLVFVLFFFRILLALSIQLAVRKVPISALNFKKFDAILTLWLHSVGGFSPFKTMDQVKASMVDLLYCSWGVTLLYILSFAFVGFSSSW